MKKNTTILLIAIVLFSCKKEVKKTETPETLKTVIGTKTIAIIPPAVLLRYDSLIKQVVALINVKELTILNVKTANSTPDNRDKVLAALKIDKAKYTTLQNQMLAIIRSTEKSLNLLPQANKDLWSTTYASRVPGDDDISGSDAACMIKAGAVFAATSIGCIALSNNPLTAVWTIPCTNFAIANLTASMVECAKKDKLPPVKN